jgi:transposase
MAWIFMSERDLRRIEVLSEVRTGRRTVAAAAAVLAVSERQAHRLLAKYELDGGSGLIHKARGRTSNRRTNEGVRKYAVELVKTRYADFGPTLATEVLLDKHQLQVGRRTLRR